MKPNRLSILAMATMLGSFAQTSEIDYYGQERKTSSKPKEPIIPKGCKEYHFTRSGRFDTTENMWNDIHYVFSCYASNDKNAVRKFEKWDSKNK